MPFVNNQLCCVNHPEKPMERIAGFNSLNHLTATPNGPLFHSQSGIPVKTFHCSICGYLELYAANQDPEWLADMSAPTGQ
jgi:hypothetical protein